MIQLFAWLYNLILHARNHHKKASFIKNYQIFFNLMELPPEKNFFFLKLLLKIKISKLNLINILEYFKWAKY